MPEDAVQFVRGVLPSTVTVGSTYTLPPHNEPHVVLLIVDEGWKHHSCVVVRVLRVSSVYRSRCLVRLSETAFYLVLYRLLHRILRRTKVRYVHVSRVERGLLYSILYEEQDEEDHT